MLIFAKVNNASSKDMTPKFSLTRSVEFRAQGDTKNEEQTVEKLVDEVIKSYTEHEVKCELRIPPDEMPSIENCEIISVTHQLKVRNAKTQKHVKKSILKCLFTGKMSLLTLIFCSCSFENVFSSSSSHQLCMFSHRYIWTSALHLIQRSFSQ